MKYVFSFLLLVLLCGVIFGKTVYAADLTEEMQKEIEQFLAVLPEDMQATWGDTLRTPEIADANAPFRISVFLERVGETLRNALPSVGDLLLRLLALLLLSAVFGSMQSSLAGTALSGAFSLIAVLCFSLTLSESLLHLIRASENCVGNLASLASAITPLATVCCAAAGRISGATVTHTALMFVYTLLQNGVRVLLVPIARVSMCLTFCGVVGQGIRLDAINRTVRRLFTWLLSLIVLLVTFVIGIQTAIAASADSFSMRTARFALGSFIPLVGGALSDALGTVSASLSLIKNTAGGICMAALFLSILPFAAELLLSRAVLSLCHGIAEMLGRDTEGRLLSEMHGILGYMLALVMLVSVLFIFVLALLIGVSLGGG